MGEFSPWHLLILAAVFVLLFGAKKLPDAARSVGRSLRIFKAEVKGLHDDDKDAETTPPAPPAQLPAGQTPVAQTPVVQTPAAPPTPVPGERSDSL
ncbi:MAG: sec-independent protein translocase protein TatA [Frankiaceae bacterium]|jgi:sec-independent protein translocase protein TatA|nr:sec-independent protein translocase protein TatA [Frankiaceae bacterium]